MFEGHSRADFPLTLLWQQGDSVDTARQRLHAIPVSPRAQFEDVDVIDGEDGGGPFGDHGDWVMLKVPVVHAHADAGVKAQ
jgi:hypothetical protein